MINEIFGLYEKTLPFIKRNDEKVKQILADEGNFFIFAKEKNELTGISVINANTIYLLCVDTSFRGRGIGSELLRQSEEYIASGGFGKVILGAGKDYIMPGVPMQGETHEFFKKKGYTHSWDETRCFDMNMPLAKFSFSENIVGDTIGGITYRWAREADIEAVLACVQDAYPDFVQYYQDKNFYQDENETIVLIAEKCGEVIGTLHVNIEVEGKGVGSVGCTTTITKHRGKGIATKMVLLGTRHLKDIGLTEGFLGYTYTDIVGMYGRAGYEVCAEYFMGVKNKTNRSEILTG